MEILPPRQGHTIAIGWVRNFSNLRVRRRYWSISLERGMVVIYYDVPPPIVLQMLREWAGLFHGDRDGIVIVAHSGLVNENCPDCLGQALETLRI